MCGIAGLIDRQSGNIPEELFSMLHSIQHRGPDASGVALFGKREEKATLRATLKSEQAIPEYHEMISRYGTPQGEEKSYGSGIVTFSELQLTLPDEDIPALHAGLNSIRGVTVHSLGRGVSVYKENGPLKVLEEVHTVRPGYVVSHGIGHVRMATESAEDVNAAHPFVSPFYPELAIVHNGQFTNYFNMRRFLEAKGARFKTMNDSEAASHLIAYAMRENGGDLEDALRYALGQMDGIFCILAATRNQIGFVKDKLGIKPLLLLEDDHKLMFGSEQIEFSTLAGDAFAEEMDPGEVRVWNI